MQTNNKIFTGAAVSLNNPDLETQAKMLSSEVDLNNKDVGTTISSQKNHQFIPANN